MPIFKQQDHLQEMPGALLQPQDERAHTRSNALGRTKNDNIPPHSSNQTFHLDEASTLLQRLLPQFSYIAQKRDVQLDAEYSAHDVFKKLILTIISPKTTQQQK